MAWWLERTDEEGRKRLPDVERKRAASGEARDSIMNWLQSVHLDG